MIYQVRHTVDALSGRCCSDGGWLDEETDDLVKATAAAKELPGGYVRRTSDGAVLAPNGAWIDDDGDEIG